MAKKARQQAVKKPTPTMATTATICELLMISFQRLGQLVSDGVIKRHAKNQYPLVETVQAYIKFRFDENRRSSKSEADSRVRDARAHEIEVRTLERLGKLVSIEDYFAMIDGITGAFRAEMSGLPARLTRDLNLRKKAEREVDELIRRIHQVANSFADRLAAGRENSQAIAEDDTGRMGSQQSNVFESGSHTGAA